MTKDYTLAVDELRRHYNELTAHKKSVRAMVKAEFEAKIDFEIQRRIEAEELKFANHLAAVKERESLPVSIIQDHVLRTRTWSRWEKWRDLAGVEAERVTVEDARAQKRRETARYLWNDDYTVLTVQRDSTGKAYDPAIEYVMPERLKKIPGGLYWPDATDAAAERVAAKADPGYLKDLSAEISARIDAGDLSGE